MIYLDHNATTPVAPEVADAVSAALANAWGNPSSSHEAGRVAKEALEHARGQVAALLGGAPAQVCFLSGATEADNLAVRSVALASSRRAFVCPRIEHPAIVEACKKLEAEGWEGRWIAPDSNGAVDLETVEAVLDDQVAFVACMLANNETGVIQPVAQISERARSVGAFAICDAVQAAGKIPFDVDSLGAHYVVVTAHKIYGPKGIGAMWVDPSAPLQAQILGGSQERGRRGGTENVPGAVGLGAACELAMRERDELSRHLAILRDAFEAGALEQLDDVVITGAQAQRLPNTSNILFRGVEGEGVALALDLEGFAVSAGSACHSGAAHPSAVLTAMGLSAADALAAVRISFGRTNTSGDVDKLLTVLPAVVGRLREAAVA